MKPSEETIQRFRKAYSEEFGKEMTADEAYDELTNLVELLRVVLGPKLLRQFKNSDKTRQFDETRGNGVLDNYT